MMKQFLMVCGSIGLLSIASAFTLHNDPPGKKSGKAAAIRTVIIDPGHGGLYPGAHGLISTEKNVTLEIALKLGEAIRTEFPDMKVIYTRTTDACSGNASNLKDDLHNRASIANDSRGDLFISIHCNATPQPAGGYYMKRVIGHRKKTVMVGRGRKKRKKTINEPIYEAYWVKNMRVGTETYVWKAEKKSDKLNAINRNDETTEESGEVIEDSTAEASAFDINSSAFLASLVEEEFKAAGRTSYGVKQRDVGIQVLQATGMPSVLIETGFLTNKEEEEYLNSAKGQEEIVGNIVDAFKKYKQSMETKPGGRAAGGARK